MTFGALSGFLIGPPMIGFFAEQTTLQFAFVLLVPGLIASFLFSRHLSVKRHHAGGPYRGKK